MITATYILECITELIPLEERFLSNMSDITRFIDDLSNSTRPEIGVWVRSKLQKYLINEYDGVRVSREAPPSNSPQWALDAYDRGEEFVEVIIDRELTDYLGSVVDNLEVLSRAKDENIRRDYEKMLKSEARVTLQLIDAYQERLLRIKGTKISHQAKNGFYWVTLHTQEAIRHEGILMGNCLKQYTKKYWDQVKSGSSILYSLRDSNGKPKVDIETSGDNKVIRQIFGWQDKIVPEAYWDYCWDFVSNFNVRHINSPEYIGGVVYNDKLYRKDDLPVEMEWEEKVLKAERLDYDIMKGLLERGVNPDTYLEHGYIYNTNVSALNICVSRDKDVKIINLLLDSGADPLFYVGDKVSPLETTIQLHDESLFDILAAKVDMSKIPTLAGNKVIPMIFKTLGDPANDGILRSFVKRGHPLEGVYNNQYGYSLVTSCIYWGFDSALKTLLDIGASPNARDKTSKRYLPIEWAVGAANKTAVHILVDRGVDLDLDIVVMAIEIHKDKKDSNSLDIIKILLESGADPDRGAPLLLVCGGANREEPNLELVLELLKAGADVNVSKDKVSPLSLACSRSDGILLATGLLKYGADPNTYNEKDEPVLVSVCRLNGSDEETFKFCKLLLENGADVDKKDSKGQTAARIAQSRRKPKTLELLFSYGAEQPSAPENEIIDMFYKYRKDQTTPDYTRLEELLKSGVDPDMPIETLGAGPTPLVIAARQLDYKAAQLLLQYGADPNAGTVTKGITPLIAACEEGQEKIIQLLLDYKADPDKESFSGQTPLFMTLTRSPSSLIVSPLLQAGADPNKKWQGQTPLSYAKYHGYDKIIDLLRQYGAEESASREDDESY
jgi:ankyrin repeat protein